MVGKKLQPTLQWIGCRNFCLPDAFRKWGKLCLAFQRVFSLAQLMDINIRNLRLLQFSNICTEVKWSAQIHWVPYTARGSFCQLNLWQMGQYPLLSFSQGFPTALCWCGEGARGQLWCADGNDGQVSALCGGSDSQKQSTIFVMTQDRVRQECCGCRVPLAVPAMESMFRETWDRNISTLVSYLPFRIYSHHVCLRNCGILISASH